jgi:hypothetical protein
MSEALRRLVAALGKADKFDDALTRQWIDVIQAARLSHPEARSFEDLVAARPDLLKSSTVRREDAPSA